MLCNGKKKAFKYDVDYVVMKKYIPINILYLGDSIIEIESSPNNLLIIISLYIFYISFKYNNIYFNIIFINININFILIQFFLVEYYNYFPVNPLISLFSLHYF